MQPIERVTTLRSLQIPVDRQSVTDERVSPLRDLTAEMFDKNLWTQCPADASSPGIDIARKEQFQNLQDCFEALDSVYQGSPAAQVGTPEPLVTPESTLGRLDM